MGVEDAGIEIEATLNETVVSYHDPFPFVGLSDYFKNENVNVRIIPNQTAPFPYISRGISVKTTENSYFVGGYNGPNETIETSDTFVSFFTRTGARLDYIPNH
ncbi:hypothetical protein RZS08_03035, partial [Arthrospira platensis SPKY1]|nr:hypothetical protein [Arthrospira platensis SPKY1]